MGAARGAAICRFEGLTLDLDRGVLVGCDGAEIALRAKSFRLLCHLVEHAGRLISREELMVAVWPGVTVTDDSITQCIREVRRAIGDERQRLLRTLPRRGYLFAAPVSRAEAALAVTAAPETSVGEAPPAPPTGRPMVVVLPFETIGGDDEQRYFAEGLTADLVTDLTRFQSLHVVSPVRRSAGLGRALPATPWAVQPVAGAAGYLVSGNVRRAGGRIRVTAQLEDAQSGVNLWAERFDRPLEDLFAVQEELATQIAGGLAARVDQEGLRRAKRRPPANLDAYDLCLRGRDLIGRSTEADTAAGRQMLDRALAADPDYASAHAWQAFAVQRGFTHRWGEPKGEAALALALEHANRAVEIEPDSPLSLGRLAFILVLSRRHDEAIEAGRRAIALNPGAYESRVDYGIVLTNAGDPEGAVRELRLAMALDPFHPPILRAVLGKALLLAGDPGAALAELRWATALVPDYFYAYPPLAVAAAETGHLDEARAAVATLCRRYPTLSLANAAESWCMRHEADVVRMLAGLRAAGLPEG
ncbi:winged helix-turn-helix domain-containing tetratricopeptide repeat protein [Elioraea sp.]|uniref:winged helix-turn-helix domain-containing tetratricopeptide repeat protein n=1 Tax=Elioraea sp. TaxID=2185103 RepID=UPI003F715887